MDKEVSLIFFAVEELKDVKLKKIAKFFSRSSGINVKGISTQSINKLYDHNFVSITAILHASKTDLTYILGKNGTHIYNNIHTVLTTKTIHFSLYYRS